MIFHSSIESIYFLLPLLGFVIGLFGTMLGGGGGFFFLPILTLVLHVPAQTAVITSLVATLPVCFVGSLGHSRKGNIDFRIGSLFIIAGVVGAFAGTFITSLISAGQLKAGFGIYSILIAVNMAWGAYRNRNRKKEDDHPPMHRWAKLGRSSFFGLFAGSITGAFGTSGTAPVLAGLFSMRIPVKMVIGTSLLVVLINTVFAIGAHFLLGQIDLTLVYFLTAGSALGALVGPRLLGKTKIDKSESKAKYIYAAVMVAIGVLMIIR